MIKCVNPDCENYKQELEDLELCPVCGKETEKSETKLDSRRKVAPIVSIGSILAILLTLLLFENINFYAALGIGGGIIVLCIVVAFTIRIKSAEITTLLAAAGLFGILAYYGLFG